MEFSSYKIKIFLIFQEMELSSSKINFFFYFQKWKFIALYFSDISGGNFPSSKNKKNHSEKVSYISGN